MLVLPPRRMPFLPAQVGGNLRGFFLARHHTPQLFGLKILNPKGFPFSIFHYTKIKSNGIIDKVKGSPRSGIPLRGKKLKVKGYILKFKNLIKNKRAWGLVVAGLLIGVLYLGFGERLRKKPEIETAKVKKGEITKTISASGEVVAQTEAILKFQASGMLAWVGVREGDQVKKWQAIASLDKRELEKTFQKYANDYLSERWDFEQTQEDYEETKEMRLVTDAIQRTLDQAQYDLNKAVLDYEIKDLAVKYATIYSPIEGIVTQIDSPVAGVNITPATAEFTIADPNSVIFEANVDEVDIGQVKVGQKSSILLDAYPDEEIEVEVKKIDFTATATSGGGTAFKVEFRLPENIEEKFKLGMNGDIDIILEKKEDILVVPAASVFSRKDRRYVWVAANGKLERREVKIGLESDTQIEVIDGLAEGEIIVSQDVSKVKEGQQVNL